MGVAAVLVMAGCGGGDGGVVGVTTSSTSSTAPGATILGTIPTTTTSAPASDPDDTSQTTPEDRPSPDERPYYSNCSAARESGAAPLFRGDPGYGAHLDPDGDGTACA